MARPVFILFACFMMNYMLTAGEIKSQGASVAEFDIREELDERMYLFEEAVQYIRQGNLDVLRQLDADVEDALSLFADWERTRQGIVRGIRVRTSSDEEINRLAGKFLETVMDATSARMEVSLRWPLFIETQQAADRFAEQLEHFIDVHQTMFEAADEMYRNRSAVSLPAMAGVYGPTQVDLAAGHRCEIEYIVENYGTVRRSEIELRVETIAGEALEDIWTMPEQIATVSPGKAVKFQLCIGSEHTGQDLVRLLIESDDIRETETLRIIQRN